MTVPPATPPTSANWHTITACIRRWAIARRPSSRPGIERVGSWAWATLRERRAWRRPRLIADLTSNFRVLINDHYPSVRSFAVSHKGCGPVPTWRSLAEIAEIPADAALHRAASRRTRPTWPTRSAAIASIRCGSGDGWCEAAPRRHVPLPLVMFLSPLGERLGEGVMQETVFGTPSPNLSPSRACEGSERRGI
jgi:hypothetical protein